MQIGGPLGVDLMVSGTLVVMGTDVLVNLVLIDVRKATVVRREAEKIALKDMAVDQACLRAVDRIPPMLLPGAASEVGRLWTRVAVGGARGVGAAAPGRRLRVVC